MHFNNELDAYKLNNETLFKVINKLQDKFSGDAKTMILLAEIEKRTDRLNNTIGFLFDQISAFEALRFDYNWENKSILSLMNWYNTNKIIDKDRAEKVFVNGMVLIVVKGNTFNGKDFKIGNKVTDVSKILSHSSSINSEKNLKDYKEEMTTKFDAMLKLVENQLAKQRNNEE